MSGSAFRNYAAIIAIGRGGGPTRCGSDGGMRVVAVLPEAYGGFGGIAQYLRDFLSALASNRASRR